ncbi:MAG: 3-hydroxyacyl-CoA dehydrogenase family protein, partial [Candidatus Thorarchaeota archaeon]
MEDIKNILVIGVGLMGNGIAQISLMAGYNTTLVDISQEIIDKAVVSIEDGLNKLESKGVLKAAEILARMKTSLDLASAVKDADLIIEAVVEDMDVKKKVFKTCDENAPSHAIIASNTSTMSITKMATATKRPDKCIGMHFFNPAPLMRLIEVIAGEKTSDKSMQIGVKISKSLPCLRGDRYVAKVLKDRPGFIVNRLNAPGGIYMNYLLDTCL